LVGVVVDDVDLSRVEEFSSKAQQRAPD
jgi:hypothetical protein